MSEFNFDEIEEFYKKSVLGDKKEEKKPKHNKNKMQFLVFFIMSLLVIGIIIKLAMPNKTESNAMQDIKLETGGANGNGEENPNYALSDSEEDKGELEAEKKDEENIINEKVESPEKQKMTKIVTSRKNTKNVSPIAYMIQVTASKDKNALEKEKERLKKIGCSTRIIDEGGKYRYKLIVSNEFSKREMAEQYMINLKKRGKIPEGSWVKIIDKTK